MSENLKRKSAGFVCSLIKFLCSFRPGPRQNFFIAPARAGAQAKPKSPAGAPVDHYSARVIRDNTTTPKQWRETSKPHHTTAKRRSV